jgi:hypothetical protein
MNCQSIGVVDEGLAPMPIAAAPGILGKGQVFS